jgi:hypothetical protein
MVVSVTFRLEGLGLSRSMANHTFGVRRLCRFPCAAIGRKKSMSYGCGYPRLVERPVWPHLADCFLGARELVTDVPQDRLHC